VVERMTVFSSINKPTLLINEEKAKRNLLFINEKVSAQGKQFRPHFKTHQSGEIGEWFREIGISKITVSSIDMANYFADHNWNDIFIAFPVNILQIEDIVHLSSKICLSLMFEELDTVSFIDNHVKNQVSGWIKIDTGANRCGLKNNQFPQILQLAKKILNSKNIEFKGLATHAGHTYRLNKKEDIQRVYHQSIDTLLEIKNHLLDSGIPQVNISVGDTPSTRLVDDYGEIDELRPGNFLLYDVQQFQSGVCKLNEIAVAVVCPVVAVHPEQNEVVIYGGAIHLSKDTHNYSPLLNAYGLVTLPDRIGWSDQKVFGYVRLLSQEHGVIVFPEGIPEHIKSGSLVCVLPAHSCLTVQEMRTFTNLDGEKIFTMLS
jgi:D-serine deaminase-like pyridoxal phosphate-dependent protein